MELPAKSNHQYFSYDLSQQSNGLINVDLGQNRGNSGKLFESQLWKLFEGEAGEFLPSYSQRAAGLTNVWINTEVARSLGRGSTSGVEFDGARLEHHLNFPMHDLFLDGKWWKVGGRMDVDAVIQEITSAAAPQNELSRVIKRAESCTAQLTRQKLAAASLAMVTKVPTKVEWLFYSRSVMTQWALILFSTHRSPQIEALTEIKVDLAENLGRAMEGKKQALYKRALQTFGVVAPGGGTRAADDFLKHLEASELSFRWNGSLASLMRRP